MGPKKEYKNYISPPTQTYIEEEVKDCIILGGSLSMEAAVMLTSPALARLRVKGEFGLRLGVSAITAFFKLKRTLNNCKET